MELGEYKVDNLMHETSKEWNLRTGRFHICQIYKDQDLSPDPNLSHPQASGFAAWILAGLIPLCTP